MTLTKRHLLASLSVLALLALPAAAQTVGPSGEAATPAASVTVDDAQLAELNEALRKGDYAIEVRNVEP